MKNALKSSHYQIAISKIIEKYNGTSILGMDNEQAAFEIYKYILETAELVNFTSNAPFKPDDIIRVFGYTETPEGTSHRFKGELMTVLSIDGDIVTFGLSTKQRGYKAHIDQCKKVRLC